jgi:pyrroloquinoline quinone biosynthesis protein D
MDDAAHVDRARKPKIAARARLRDDAPSSSVLLVFPEGALELNATAAEVLRLCDGTHSIDDIAGLLAGRFADASPDDVARDVAELLSALIQRRLVEL